MKLVPFLQKNHYFPFVVKQKVMDAAFFAAILYGCESWFNQVYIMNQLYMYVAAIKALSVLRIIFCDCLNNLSPISGAVLPKNSFRHKRMKDDSYRTSQGLYIKQLLAATCDYKQNGMDRTKTEVKSEKTKYVTHVRMNPVIRGWPL